MTYFFTTPSIVPNKFGADEIETYLSTTLENYQDLTLEFEEDTKISTVMARAAGPDDLKVIDVVTNPYNRAFLYYLDVVLPQLTGTSTPEEIAEHATPEDFQNFVSILLSTSDEYAAKRINSSVEIRADVDFTIMSETYATDLKLIPELADMDTDSVLRDYTCLYNNLYREYYDDETKKIVATIYAQDLAYHGYTF